MLSFKGFSEFLNEMLVNHEPGGTMVIAFRQWLWVINHTSNQLEDIVNKLTESHPRGKELLNNLKNKDIFGITQWIKDYFPDALTGYWSEKNKDLHLDINPSLGVSVTTSPLVRKVTAELKANKVHYTSFEEKNITKKTRQIKGNWDAIWYHGTSTNYIEDILRLGLKPGESSSNYADQGVYHNDIIFLTSKLEEAQHHGFHTTEKVGGLPIVVQVNRLPDKSLIKPDYDVDHIASRNTYATPPSDKYDPIFSVDSMKASKHAGLIGYQGRIPATYIDAVIVHSESREKWIRIRDLDRLKKHLVNWGEEFWYRYGEPVVPKRSRY